MATFQRFQHSYHNRWQSAWVEIPPRQNITAANWGVWVYADGIRESREELEEFLSARRNAALNTPSRRRVSWTR